MQFLSEVQDTHSQQKHDFDGVVDKPLQIALKSDVARKKQRIKKVLTHNPDKMQKFLDDIQRYGIIDSVASKAARNVDIG